MTTEEMQTKSPPAMQEVSVPEIASQSGPTDSSISRSTDGRFVEGQSGNPKGRPLSTRNQITKLKQSLELAVRENVGAKDISAIIDMMVLMAAAGSVPAAKLILDKVLSNAKVEEDAETGDKKVTIYVRNATFGSPDSDEPEIIDVTPEE